MDDRERVVVTGMGLLTPMGSGLEANWSGISEGKSALTSVCFDEAEDLPCRVGGVIPCGAVNLDRYFESSKDSKRLSSFIIYGIVAASDAVWDSGILDFGGLDFDRVGVCIGSGIGGIKEIQDNAVTMDHRGHRKVSPFFIPSSLINLLSGHVSIKFGFKGPNDSIVSACSTGAAAMVSASRAIKLGEADAMVVGGAEATVNSFATAGFAVMKALATQFNDRPHAASRPWDADRCGFVMGEGAGVLLLESLSHAKKRDARIYAEIVGWGMTGDAYHMAAPEPSGRGAAQAMATALKMAGLSVSDIGYINAHGTSTKHGDLAEAHAIKQVFGDHAFKLPISSTKSSVGHLLGAAGAVEAIYSICAMRNGILPPTLNLDNPDVGCDLDFIPHKAREKKVNAVLSNSFGFGGTNVSLIIANV